MDCKWLATKMLPIEWILLRACRSKWKRTEIGEIGVIIFCLFWFLFIKIIKLKFCKIEKIKLKPNWNRFQPIGFGLIWLFYIKNQNPTHQFWFGLVLLFNIKNKKLYCFLGFFLDFLMSFMMGLVSVRFGFLVRLFYIF
jgi:hypothetical protein